MLWSGKVSLDCSNWSFWLIELNVTWKIQSYPLSPNILKSKCRSTTRLIFLILESKFRISWDIKREEKLFLRVFFLGGFLSYIITVKRKKVFKLKMNSIFCMILTYQEEDSKLILINCKYTRLLMFTKSHKNSKGTKRCKESTRNYLYLSQNNLLQ